MVPSTLAPAVDRGEGLREAAEAPCCREEKETLGSKVVGKVDKEEPSEGAAEVDSDAADAAVNDDVIFPEAFAA